MFHLDAENEFAPGGITRNGGTARDRVFTNIQAEVSYAMIGVRSVAVGAVFREDGPDVAVEVHAFGCVESRERR